MHTLKSFTMDIDSASYNRFKKGDVDAFFRKAYPSLLSIAVKLLPEEYLYMAEDVVQNSIFSAYRNREGFESPANLKAYLYSCVHNEAASVVRKDVSRSRYLASQQRHLPVDMSMEGKMMIQETMDMLYDAIDELPEEYRQVFELSYVQGLSNAEMAAAIGLSLSGTKKRKARFLEMMRDKLSGNDSLYVCLMLMELSRKMMC